MPLFQISSVQLLSRVQLFVTPCITALQASLSITNSWSSLKLTSIKSVMPSSHLILSSPFPPAPNPFQHQSLFQWVSFYIRWPKYRSFNFSISPSNEYSGLIPIRIDWFWSPCLRDSQESSPTPRFKSINSSVLSFLHSPTFTFIHDYWKNHSLD